MSMARNIYSGKRNEAVTLTVNDYRYLISMMNKVEPGASSALRKESKDIARKVANSIKPAIPARRPLSGMQPKVEPGRLTWGTGKPARSALVKSKTPKAKDRGWISLSSIWFGSAATVIASVAGSSGKYLAKYPRTRMYPYSGAGFNGQRDHKITRVGSQKFVQNLNTRASGKISMSPKGKQTRYIWWAAERAMPAAAKEIEKTISVYAAKFNAELRKR